MKDMLNLPGQGPIYIIVDALDECPNLSGTPSAREEVLELIGELVNLKLPNVNLCVASRPEMDIRLVLEPLTTLKISLHDEIGQKKDITEYINSIVRSDMEHAEMERGGQATRRRYAIWQSGWHVSDHMSRLLS
jgi:hypothetical protein